MLEKLSGFLVIVTPLAVIWISYKQYKFQRASFDFELYKQRFVVYEAFIKFFEEHIKSEPYNAQSVEKFYSETKEIRFLFPEKIVDKREEIFLKAKKLAEIREKMNQVNDEINRNSPKIKLPRPGGIIRKDSEAPCSDPERFLELQNEYSRLQKEEIAAMNAFYNQRNETEKLFAEVMEIYSKKECFLKKWFFWFH